MAKWSLKNRNSESKPPDMPPAAENYYRAEKRDRMVGVWLLGLATLAVTAVLAFLLFLGGRWVYRQFTDNEANAPETSQTEESSEVTGVPEAPADSTQNDSGDENQNSGTADVAGTNEDSENDTDANNDEGTVSEEAATTDLPNTGPADTLALFLGVTVIAALLHRTVIAKESH